MKPKIICTLGTTTDKKEVLEKMVEGGMAVARMNTAYADIALYQSRLDMVRQAGHVEIMMDLKGPQVRLVADRRYDISEDDIIIASFRSGNISFTKEFYNDVDLDDRVLIENGTISTTVIRKENGRLHLAVDDPGEGYIHKQMGVNIPGKYLDVEKLSMKDKEVIDFCVRNDVEYIAQSFVRDRRDLLAVKDMVEVYNRRYAKDYQPTYVAKIEDRKGISNLEDTIRCAKDEGLKLQVMVARGDLAVELPMEELPYAQKEIIDLCKTNKVPVIVATGLLASMQYGPKPTRAEVNDVYNAISQGADALMLSGETSNGIDPVKAVQFLNRTLEKRYD